MGTLLAALVALAYLAWELYSDWQILKSILRLFGFEL